MIRYLLILIVSIICLSGIAISGATICDIQELSMFDDGARLAGMGRAGSGLSNDLDAAFANPAGLASIQRWHLSSNLSYLSAKATRGSVRLGGSEGSNHLGFALSAAQLQGVGSGPGERWVSDVVQYTAGAGYARWITSRLAGGVGAEVILCEGLGRNSPGVGVDLGLRYNLPKQIVVTVSLNDLALKRTEGAGQEQPRPQILRFGSAIEDILIGRGCGVAGAVDLLFIEDDKAQLHLGAELVIPSNSEVDLKLRGGYNGYGLSIGAGIVSRYVRVDYAFSSQPERAFFDDYAHEISVSFVPGDVLDLLSKGSREAVSEYRYERFQYHSGQAKRAAEKSKFEVARDEYLRADAFTTSRAQSDSVRAAGIAMQEAIDRLRSMADSASLRIYDDSVSILRQQLTDSVIALGVSCEERLAIERRMLLGWQQSELIAQARTHFENGEYYSALGKVSLILDSDPTDAAAIVLREEVMADIQRVLTSNTRPTDPGAILRELDSMFVHMIGVDRLVSDSVVAEWYRRGINHSRQEEYQEAIEIWQRVYGARPDHPTVLDDIRAAQRRLEATEQE